MFVLFIHELSKCTIMSLKNTYRFLFIALTLIGSFSCSDKNERSGYIDPNEELLEGLSKVKGYDHTYNYDFKILQFREKIQFYEPIDVSGGMNRIPSEMRNNLHLISSSDLPFTVNQQGANIVTSWNDKNQLVFQIQISYLENDFGYDTNFKDFFIISVTQCPVDPFAIEENRLDLEKNLPRTYEILTLNDGHPLYYQPGYGTWPRMFDYYYYAEDENRMYKESTGSYQYYAWYNGLIFKIGCNGQFETDKMEALVRKIILGN